MNCPSISIVVTIYNVKEYLEQCIESIIIQINELTCVEVILVNDGSLDGSGEIAENYGKKYDFIRVISHQSNEGLSIARNTGIHAANGSWIWFVDSDDWIDQSSLNTLFKIIEENQDCDVICIQKNNILPKESWINDVIPHSQKMSGIQYLKSGLQNSVAQKFIVKRKFLLDNNLFFFPHILHEDLLYCNMLLYSADKIFVSEKPLYQRRCERPGSITMTKGLKNAQDMIIVHKELMRFADSKVKLEDKEWFFKLSFGIIRYAYRIIARTDYYHDFQKENKNYIRSICKKGFHYKSLRFKLRTLYVRFLPRYLCQIEQLYAVARKMISYFRN